MRRRGGVSIRVLRGGGGMCTSWLGEEEQLV